MGEPHGSADGALAATRSPAGGLRAGKGARFGAGRSVLGPEEKEARRLARIEGHKGLLECVKFWLDTVRDPNADWRNKNRASENLADRFGLSRRHEIEADLGVSNSDIVQEILEGFRTAARRDKAQFLPGTDNGLNGHEQLVQ